MESLVDDASSGFDENDPASAERMMKQMGDQFGQDLSNEMSEAVDSSDDTPPGVQDDGGY